MTYLLWLIQLGDDMDSVSNYTNDFVLKFYMSLGSKKVDWAITTYLADLK